MPRGQKVSKETIKKIKELYKDTTAGGVANKLGLDVRTVKKYVRN